MPRFGTTLSLQMEALQACVARSNGIGFQRIPDHRQGRRRAVELCGKVLVDRRFRLDRADFEAPCIRIEFGQQQLGRDRIGRSKIGAKGNFQSRGLEFLDGREAIVIRPDTGQFGIEVPLQQREFAMAQLRVE
ncbi:hypothetical protein D9M69_582940 [compost metagenome]